MHRIILTFWAIVSFRAVGAEEALSVVAIGTGRADATIVVLVRAQVIVVDGFVSQGAGYGDFATLRAVLGVEAPRRWKVAITKSISPCHWVWMTFPCIVGIYIIYVGKLIITIICWVTIVLPKPLLLFVGGGGGGRGEVGDEYCIYQYQYIAHSPLHNEANLEPFQL